ncbi:MAG: acetyltransferase [Bryobacterales bacterium]|nr:acetyltransferase [Bryobacterales bacterium]
MAARKAGIGSLEVRPVKSLEEWHLTVGLQREIWGFDETDEVPPRLFGVILRTGGSCLGAFLKGEMVGFSLAFAGLKSSGARYWHSHMVGVRPSLHGRGIGYRIKLAQREAALAAGVERIEWTFDPLRARNAHFNVTKLGTVAHEYLPDFYGTTSSDLHGGLPTDRLVAVWHLRSRRVADRVLGLEPAPARGSLLVEIPSAIERLPRAEALAARERLRAEFPAAFARGFRVTGFTRGPTTATYHLDR